MKTFVKHLIAFFMRLALWFRYKVTVKGLDKLTPEALNKKGGVLFLPNHPCVFVDPTLITIAAWPRFPIRPMIVEYQFYTPIVNNVMRFLDALPVPNFNVSSNSLKKKKSEKVIQTVIDDLKNGQNFLIYPSGKTKSTGREAIGGASGVHRILSEAPEANVVLVRIKGLWGSSFSRALTGHSPPLFSTVWAGVKHVFKNLLFFTPRRQVIIEFEPAPADFPYGKSRLEINKYLENYYNKPDGLTKQEGNQPGDSFIQVSYSCWKNEIPEIVTKPSMEDEHIQLDKIPEEIKEKVVAKLVELTQFAPENIKPGMDLATDLGMDSLDISEVSLFLQDTYDVTDLPYNEITSVGKVMALASKQIVCKEDVEEEEKNFTKWSSSRGPRERIHVAPGKTMQEVFLNNSASLAKHYACADMRSGMLTFGQMKMRALLLANYIRELPGDYIGILLPASLGASLLIMAVQLAGKIPLMINWTVGPRHLEAVKAISNVESILTSWAFIDKLDNVDFNGLEDNMIMLEDLRSKLKLTDKIKAFLLSKRSTTSILKKLKLENVKETDPAVLLFTSGSESMPKGVPLSHKNILSNQRDILDGIEVYNDDILLSILPPFHSFGFTVTGLLCVSSGVRTAFSPDPKDGQRIANAIERFKATVMGGTPTFIKSIMKVAKQEQLDTVRFCFTGAEKAQPELFQLMTQFGKTEDFLLEGYGITECSPVLTFNRFHEPHKGVGRAAPSVEICIVHPETNVTLPMETQGMILARGPNVFDGYLNPGLASPFVEVDGKKWYRTGDLGFLDEKGRLTISGRLKRFIKIGAEMISLASLEEALLQQGFKRGWEIKDEGVPLAVCAKEYDGEKPKIYLFTHFKLSLEEANQAIKEGGFSNLIRFSGVQQLPEIPIMGTGKTNYRVLESDYIAKMIEQKGK